MSTSMSNSASGPDRSRRYLNGILTVNAVLLAAMLWTQVAGTSTASIAAAAPQSGTAKQADTDTFPNASVQRVAMINELRGLRGDVAKLEAAVMSGKLKVQIGNPDDIKLDIDYNKLRAAMKD